MVEAAEFCNFLVGAGLLVGKLVAGETYNLQAQILVTLVKVFQTVVLGSKTALGSGVHNHENLSLVLGEVYLFALVVQGLEIINLCHMSSNKISFAMQRYNFSFISQTIF